MYCSKCGAEIMDEAVVCTKCGCLVGEKKMPARVRTQKDDSGLKKVAKIFMIISCVVMGLWIITLAWTIPMTMSYSKKIENGEPVTTGFKVCTLLFVNVIAGVLMLCCND